MCLVHLTLATMAEFDNHLSLIVSRETPNGNALSCCHARRMIG